MKVIRFESEDKQTLWEKDNGNGAVFSGAVHMSEEMLNPMTGFVNESKWLFWVKSNSAEATERNLTLLIANIKKGIMRPYRVYSETPFWEADTEDINPSTGDSLGRYSQVRLGSAKQALELDRSYIEIPVILPTESATTPVEQKEPQEHA